MVQYSDFSNSFSTLDYILVVLTLIISIAIGIYHGFRNRNNMDEVEYLMAGKKLSVIPVGISIIGSSYSALSLIGFSTEMYIYGSNFTFIIFNYVLMPYAFNKIVLPIIHPLGITSMYHYLEKRFNRAIRVFASAVFVIVVTLYLPIVLYMPGLCFFGGTLLTAVFSECDPKLAKVIQAKDQMVPLLVVMMTQILPGLSGLFTGGTFSATLSTFSTLLNCTAALILEDFCKPFYKGRLSERAKAIILRSVVVIFGLLAIPLIVIIEKTNTITQFAMSIESLASGTTVGIFALGIFFPSINGTCALIGGICSMFLVGWISWAANTAIAAGDLTFKTKPLGYAGCEEMFNVTVAPILTAGDAKNSSLPKSPSKEVTEEATELLNFREKQLDLGGDQK
uniref:Putative sodium-coupled monocarboxylate transporter 1-like isoform x3 megachile rotundata n=1 Tax=Lutzomyia longipalpis TaxID=7200 RepID=A0A1B0CT70_LUTLO